MGVLGVGLYGSNEPTLNFETSVNQSYPVALEIICYIGFLIAFAVKLPILPLHTWLPDTHGEAHHSTCMLLAGILLKMGAYGLIWINMELLPHAHSIFSPWLMVVGTIQIIYEASTSPGQHNLKKKNSLFLRISYGFHTYRNCFDNRYGTQRSYFTNNLSWLYWCCTFFLGGNEL
ncbi:putative NADH:quinone oxidoreductase/Mrp antiporter, membrane subunit [Helianthus debilis subsp. tardiflorus]